MSPSNGLSTLPRPAAAPDEGVQSLYRDHHGWLVRWLARKLGNAFDAADLAQDTFVRLITAPEANSEKQAGWSLQEPRAYLTLVAKRLLANLYRRRALEQAYLDALARLPEAQAPSSEQHAIVLQALQDIDAMLDGLRPEVRRAFLLFQIEGLDQATIAQRLGVNVRTVKRHIAQALARCIMVAP
ncbi:sigma-70 family RNA polymerase sigma factor [Stenotrophomonas sp. 24(2023)]|uniref:sigma-70 family RNA polymerase sigma factor n=1 Tax=Stenotrophomonas sp. 24(2023) TaxID=3068324 RepID=UPI0027E1F6BE|nr:sigma-70 family RNA polymerase sigma factor [Stenotrophomonas sp. 24(2023)]WMJ68198.1 sigma-70 family RNA polymerase sigma factor [Stenotrophomonas sp. 24(2023)]